MNVSGPHRVTVPAYPATSVEVSIPLNGFVVGVGLKFAVDSMVDVSIFEETDNAPDQTIYEDTGLSTDGWVYPVAQISGTDGVAVADQYTIGIPVIGRVTISLSNATGGDVVDITFKLV